MKYDIVVLTDGRYIDPKERNEYIDNVLLEDKLVSEALENLGLKVTRKSWDDLEFDWSSSFFPNATLQLHIASRLEH